MGFLILVFVIVFLFLCFFWKRFRKWERWRVLLSLAVFSLLVSVLVSSLSVLGIYEPYNSQAYRIHIPWRERCVSYILSRLSYPFYLEVEYGPVLAALNTGSCWFRIFFDGVMLAEMEHTYQSLWKMRILCKEPGLSHMDCTAPLFLQLVLIFTLLNLLSALLGIVAAYKVKTHREKSQSLRAIINT